LETDFRQIGRFILAEKVEEAVLTTALFVDTVLLGEPVLMTAFGPIGDVARGNSVSKFIDGPGDTAIRRAVEEHLID
jgi:hypothetical protein